MLTGGRRMLRCSIQPRCLLQCIINKCDEDIWNYPLMDMSYQHGQFVRILEAHMKKCISGNLVKFTFEDNVAPYTFDCTKMSGANRARAIPFAMCHRLGGSAALSRA